MNMLMVLEIVVVLVVAVWLVRFAVWYVRECGSGSPRGSVQQHSEPEHTSPAPERPSEPEADEHPSEVADRV